MCRNKSVCVVVRHITKTQISRVIETIPAYVDKIVIVTTRAGTTPSSGKKYQKAEPRIILIVHEKPGVGGAIASGCKWARQRYDMAAVMAGDGQMPRKSCPRCSIRG